MDKTFRIQIEVVLRQITVLLGTFGNAPPKLKPEIVIGSWVQVYSRTKKACILDITWLDIFL